MDALNEISLPTVLATVAAVLSPYLIAVFTRCNMSAKVKQIISAIVSVVLALAYTILKGQVDSWETFWTAAPAIYATSQLMYALFMKKSAEKVEANVGITVKDSPPAPAADEKDVVVSHDLPADEDEVTAADLIVVKPEDETPAKG